MAFDLRITVTVVLRVIRRGCIRRLLIVVVTAAVLREASSVLW